MSEWIYSLLLHLFPGYFQKAYGEDALQLLRDRMRDERGFFPRLRLWFDLLRDLAISVPREYQKTPPALATPVPQRSSDVLSFQILQGDPPRPEAIFFGTLLALAAVGAFAFAIGHYGDYQPFRHFAAPAQHTPHLRPSAPSLGAPMSRSEGDEEAIGPSPQAVSPQTVAAKESAGQEKSARQDVANPSTVVTAESLEVDAAERQRVIDAAIANLKQHYFDPAVAQTIAASLTAHAKRGDDDAVKTGAGFAALLTGQMREASQDMHLEMVYSPTVLRDHAMTPTAEELAQYRKALEQSNCTLERVETLPRNIGYLKLNSFPDPGICGAKVRAAMASLNNAGALIVDLRDNGGGMGEMVSLIAAYLFDHPEYLYSPRDVPSERSWTHSPVPGNKLADKPVYVLISRSTVSAAEDFSYNLKMLHRATFIGETTRGSAHAGVFYRLDDHFGMGVPNVKPVNPFGKADWEGVGVEPDVKVKAADALETAEKLAWSKLRKR